MRLDWGGWLGWVANRPYTHPSSLSTPSPSQYLLVNDKCNLIAWRLLGHLCFPSFFSVLTTTPSHRRVNGDLRTCCDYTSLKRCNPWPHVANRHISISQLLLLWRHSHYDVSRLRCSQPRSHYDVILIHSLLSWSRPLLWTYERTETLPRLLYIKMSHWCYFITPVLFWGPSQIFSRDKKKVLKWWLHTAK